MLQGANGFTGGTSVLAGTLQLGNANALANTGYLDLGNASTTDGTLDLNGYAATLPQPESGSLGGVITNASASPSTVTFVSSNYASHSPAAFFGTITGNLSVVYKFAAPTATTTTEHLLRRLRHQHLHGVDHPPERRRPGELAAALPTGTQGIYFAGGILYPSVTGLDFSPGFSQAAGQQYAVAWNSTGLVTPFGTSLNSSGGSLTVGNANPYLSGASTVLLTAANNYSGATLVTTGTLQVANPKGLAGTSGVTVASAGTIASASPSPGLFSGTLQINDSSGTVGLSGGVAGGAPITATLNGLGTASSSVQYTTGIAGVNLKYFYAGFAFYGALQGVAGGNAVWAGNVAVPAAGAGLSGGFNTGRAGPRAARWP